jgi:hypothetical protein
MKMKIKRFVLTLTLVFFGWVFGLAGKVEAVGISVSGKASVLGATGSYLDFDGYIPLALKNPKLSKFAITTHSLVIS